MRRIGSLALPVLLAIVTLGPAGLSGPGDARAQQPYVQLSSSESYYKLDVPAGGMRVEVDITIRNNQKGELAEVYLFVMPGAGEVVVTREGKPLAAEVKPGEVEGGQIGVVTAKLEKPLRPNLEVDLKMSYAVSQQTNDYTRLEPGVMESVLVSQGPGSFVFIDVPKAGDNFLDPGCLLASSQPNAVRDAGQERWICGDALLIAINTEDKSVQQQCANADDRCRQRTLSNAWSAYAQSVTDESKRGVLESEVLLQRGPVKLSLKYFRSDEAWAQRQFEEAKRALPLLEQVFGYPYPHDRALLRQSTQIERLGAAGVAFTGDGEMLLADGSGVDDEVTVHELAHQWAGHNLETAWLWEGLAEYATRVVAPELGITPRDWGWQSFGYKDPLATWYNGSPVYDARYWYGKAGAFWFAYEAAIGGREKMRTVLGEVDDATAAWPLDGEWFMDAGERVSGTNLDALFMEWVFNPETAGSLLQQRREARNLTSALHAEAAAAGLEGIPPEILVNLNAWTFGPIADQVSQARKILADYVALRTDVRAAGLDDVLMPRYWSTRPMGESRGLVGDLRQALDAIKSAEALLPADGDNADGLAKVGEARAKFVEGDLQEAERLAAASRTTKFNTEAATKLIALAREKQAAFKEDLFTRVGLLWSDPDGDLAAAEAALAAGDASEALRLSRSAIETWDGAAKTGFSRLAILFGAMCALSVGTWYLLRKIDGRGSGVARGRTTAPGGHVLGAPEERGKWKDWENTR
jgi:hypothetical protein